MKHILYLFSWLVCSVPFVAAQTINLQQVVGTGVSSPIGVYFAPGNDQTMYVLQQGGRIKTANATTGAVSGTDFLDITSRVISSGNEQGLLGLVFHPDYANNGYFFVNYTRAGNGATVVARYKRSTANPLVADPASEKIVMQISQPYSNHNGGQLQIGRDGYLYIGMGDGGSANDPQANGQNGLVRLAKMLRVDIDVDSGYAIPAGNPFVGDNTRLPEIWALGVRNPWRFSFDMKTADLWIADVGQNVWEEIDFEPAGMGGRNYGWRCYEGNTAFNTANCGPASAYTSPIFVYNHTGGNCSVTGGFVYRGGSFADLYGKYIFTDYCSGKFWLTSPDGSGGWTTNQVTTTPSLTNQLTSFGQNGKGEMYVVSRDGNKIYRLAGTPCAPADIYTADGSLESCTGHLTLKAPYGPDNQYAWYRNDTLLTETTNVLDATRSGIYRVQVQNTTNSCGNQAVAEVIVSQPAVVSVSLASASVCADAGVLPITVSPAGGTVTGPGVTGLNFNPQGLSGLQRLVYSYTNTDGCTSSDTFGVTVHALPVVSFTVTVPPNGFCLGQQVTLTGQPAGGTFFGPGVAGNTFSATVAGLGPHTLTYLYTDANGCSATAESAAFTVSDCNAGIAEESAGKFSVFPNPSGGVFRIESAGGVAEVKVYDAAGRLVYDKTVNAAYATVDLSDRPAGSYRLRVTLDNGKHVQRTLILEK